MVKAYFSFDKETKKLVRKLGYIPKDCYCTTEPNVFVPEHAEKNRKIVKLVAKTEGIKVTLARFSQRENLEVF